MSQSGHGTVALAGTTATYFPDTGFAGGDTFTFAAWDGSTDSNLGTAFISVGGGGGSGPDLAGQWLSLAQRCKSKNGARCRLRGKVRVLNQGPVAAGASVLRFYLSPTATLNGGASLLKEVSVKRLKPGTRRKKGLTVTLTAPASGQYVLAVLDATNLVAERDEGNDTVPFGPLD